jgi:acylphosphatase
MGEKCVRITINGRVQGVGFRAWLERRASSLALKGWVRNRADGSVEAVLLGPEATVDRMIGICREGPRLSVVSNVEVSPATNEDWPDFSVRPTV